MTVKYTQLFNAVTIDKDGNAFRSSGWSESHYTSLAPNTTQLGTATSNLDLTRAALLPTNSKIVGQRVQVVDADGNVSFSRGYEVVNPGSAGTQIDLPQMSLEWPIRGGGGTNQAVRNIRGVPDARVVQGEYSPSSQFNAALLAYFTELRNNWKFKGRIRTNLKAKVLSINAEGLLVTNTPHGLNEGDSFYLMFARNVAGKKVSGLYQMGNTSNPNTGSIVNWAGGLVTGKGKVRKAGNDFFAIEIFDNEVLDPLAVSRKVGRPFHQFHGHRTVKK